MIQPTPEMHDAHEGPVDIAEGSIRELDRKVGIATSRSALLITALLVTLAGLAVFAWLARVVYAQESTYLDLTLGTWLHGFSSPGLDALMEFLSLLGSSVVGVPIVAAASLLLFRIRAYREMALLVVAYGGSQLLNYSLKALFERARPELAWSLPEHGYSFPSGHAMNSLTLYVVLAIIVWFLRGRRAGVTALSLAFILVGGIGTSRIYLGYHYFTDVVAGYSAALVWLVMTTIIMESGRAVLRRRRLHIRRTRTE